MEGVLTPEIWIAVAEKTQIPELRRTTRDEPDYDKLMRGRLKILDQHGLKLSDIQQVIGGHFLFRSLLKNPIRTRVVYDRPQCFGMESLIRREFVPENCGRS